MTPTTPRLCRVCACLIVEAAREACKQPSPPEHAPLMVRAGFRAFGQWVPALWECGGCKGL